MKLKEMAMTHLREGETGKEYLARLRGDRPQDVKGVWIDEPHPSAPWEGRQLVRIYIAGPITLGDQGANVHNAMMVAHELLDHGFAPLCPHLTMLLHMVKPRPTEDWLKMDLPWVAVADAVLRLPGESRGAEREVEYALELRIPIFYTKAHLYYAAGVENEEEKKQP